MDPMFNMMLGLSETEVREMIEYYRGAGLIKAPTDQLIAIVFKGNDLWKIEECKKILYQNNTVPPQKKMLYQKKGVS